MRPVGKGTGRGSPGPGPGGSRGRRWGVDLRARFLRELGDRDGPKEGERILVAVSGGLDSVVLLHLLRFLPGLPGFGMQVAHFDHGMRPGSRADALWVKGLCRAWSVPVTLESAHSPPNSEEEARERRYEFLLREKDTLGAQWLLTGHHADDQAETVLFRVFRGTGLKGLAGIPRRREPGILRPLLPFFRWELEAYGREEGLSWREDPTNADISIPRNYLRHRVLPGVEEQVAPGARRSLARLARLARDNEAAWESVLPLLQEGLIEADERGVFIVRSAFLAYHPTVRARLVRDLLRRRGVNLSEAGTRAVLEFTRGGSSGRSIPLPGGLSLRREFDGFVLGAGTESGHDRPLRIPGPEEGSGEAVFGGEHFGVCWGSAEPRAGRWVAALALDSLAFPLFLRPWAPGDRIHLSYGSKKLKKLFNEAGVPLGDRSRIPVLVDGSGEVVWVAGVAVSRRARPRLGDEGSFFVGIGHAHQP